MKLIRSFYSTSHERQHAYPADEAQSLVAQSLSSVVKIDGVDELRRYLMLPFDSALLDKIEKGEWLLIKDDAYSFDWGKLDAGTKAQKQHVKVMAMMDAAHQPEPSYGCRFNVLDSETGAPLAHRAYILTIDGKSRRHLTDGRGVAHIYAPSKDSEISIHVLFHSPLGEFSIDQE